MGGEAKAVHMVRASVCGEAHGTDMFSGVWGAVTCPACIRKRAHRCLHCGRDCDGAVTSIRAGFVHVECWRAFKLSPRFAAMLKADPLLLTGERCDHCGGCCVGQCWMRER